MSPRIFDDWRMGWRLRRGTAAFVASVSAEPDEGDVRWLAEAATDGDLDRARWELRYARRALGLLIAERDALNDRTSSMVARQLSETLAVDRQVAAGKVRVAERQFNDRLRSYREVLVARNATEGTGTRLGRALMYAASARTRLADDVIARASDILSGYVADANERLRKVFGAAALPADQPPSVAGSQKGGRRS